MKVGILGGTFDPIHLGHLIIAEQAREQARLDEVLFIPSARPPHKLSDPISPFDHRVEMVQLAIAGRSDFRVETLERERPGPSYTADTLTELRQRHPDTDFYLILGEDCLPDLAGWYQPLRIVEQAGLLVAARPGWEMWNAEQLADSLGLAHSAKVRIQRLEVPLIDIAGRDLRQRVAAGRSIRYLVPRAIEIYIHERGLFADNHPKSNN